MRLENRLLRAEIEHLRDAIQTNQSALMDDRYRGAQARSDFKLRDDRIDSIKDRVARLEEQMQAVIDRVPSHAVMDRRVSALDEWKRNHKEEPK